MSKKLLLPKKVRKTPINGEFLFSSASRTPPLGTRAENAGIRASIKGAIKKHGGKKKL